MNTKAKLAAAILLLTVAACQDVTSPELELEPSLATTPFVPGKIVYLTGGDIWVMDSDGQNKDNLTETPSVSEGDPALSADGSMVAYSLGGQIWTMSVTGAGQQMRFADA